MKSIMAEPNPQKRSALNRQLRALHEAHWPEPGAHGGGTPSGAVPFVIHVPLTEDQGAIGAAFAADVAMLAEETGADKTQVGDLLNFAILGALQDNVDLADEAQCWTVGSTRHGWS